MNLKNKNNMKIIINEEQLRQIIESKYLRITPKLRESINKYLDDYMSNGTRIIGKKSRNYGNFREEWCIDGVNTITMSYKFNDDEFNGGLLLVSEDVVEQIQRYFSIRDLVVLTTIAEWYEDTMIPKFESIVGESGFYIKNVDTIPTSRCVPEPVKPEGITDDEMIDFIDKNTGYKRQDIIDKIESGERDLEDYYLDIVDTVERNKYW
jgi:hypothetical protein